MHWGVGGHDLERLVTSDSSLPFLAFMQSVTKFQRLWKPGGGSNQCSASREVLEPRTSRNKCVPGSCSIPDIVPGIREVEKDGAKPPPPGAYTPEGGETS